MRLGESSMCLGCIQLPESRTLVHALLAMAFRAALQIPLCHFWPVVASQGSASTHKTFRMPQTCQLDQLDERAKLVALSGGEDFLWNDVPGVQ